MNDKELLELAAKAAGYRAHGWIGEKFFVCRTGDFAENYDPFEWNPLDNDGDALRLAVKLGMVIDSGTDGENSFAATAELQDGIPDAIQHNGDPCVATRRAIVRAAAEIGRMTGNSQQIQVAEMNTLLDAAKAVLDTWDDPSLAVEPAIEALRKAVAEYSERKYVPMTDDDFMRVDISTGMHDPKEAWAYERAIEAEVIRRAWLVVSND